MRTTDKCEIFSSSLSVLTWDTCGWQHFTLRVYKIFCIITQIYVDPFYWCCVHCSANQVGVCNECRVIKWDSMNSQRQLEKLADFSDLQPHRARCCRCCTAYGWTATVREEMPCILLAALRLFVLQLQPFWEVLTGNVFWQSTRCQLNIKQNSVQHHILKGNPINWYHFWPT